jgi:hypothetical protein
MADKPVVTITDVENLSLTAALTAARDRPVWELKRREELSPMNPLTLYRNAFEPVKRIALGVNAAPSSHTKNPKRKKKNKIARQSRKRNRRKP